MKYKGGWSYFLFDAVEVSGVSELNTLVLQNNCLLYAWIFKGFFMSHCVELQSVVYQKFIKLFTCINKTPSALICILNTSYSLHYYEHT